MKTQTKTFIAVTALSLFAALLGAASNSNPKATGDVGWVNPWNGQQVQATFAAINTKPTGNAAKGSLVYSDDTTTYAMDVQFLRVSGNQAWFAGQVTSTNTKDDCCTLGTWIVYKVQDNGEPGVGKDQIWGFSTKQTENPKIAFDMVTNAQPLDMGSHTDSGDADHLRQLAGALGSSSPFPICCSSSPFPIFAGVARQSYAGFFVSLAIARPAVRANSSSASGVTIDGMFKVHLPSDLLPENSPEARGRRFMDRVNQSRQLNAERKRQVESQKKPAEAADTGARIAELEAENARLRGVLSSIQWCSDALADGVVYHLCPICDQSEVRGHAPDCTIGAVLDVAAHLRRLPPGA